MMKQLIIFSFAILMANHTNAQYQKLDSLYRATQIAPNDSMKLDAYLKILNIRKFENPDSVRETFHKAELLALKANNLLAKANFHTNFAINFATNSEWDSALHHLNIALIQLDKLGLENNKARIYSNIAGVYRSRGYYKLAAEYQFKSVQINEKVKDTMLIIGGFNTLASIYYDMDNYSDALKYAQKARLLISPNTLLDRKAVNNIIYGAVHYKLLNYEQAIDYYQQAKIDIDSIYRQNKVMAYYYYASLYSNMADVYNSSQQFKAALANAQTSLNYYDSINAADLAKYTSYINLGKAHKGLKRKAEAQKYLMFAYKSLQNTKDYIGLDVATQELAKFYESEGNYEGALRFNQLYKQYSDSLKSLKTNNAIAELNIQYETEKKEAENAQLKLGNELKEARISRMIQLLLILSLGFVVGIAGFYIYIISKQHKISIQMHEIEKAKHYKFFHELGNEAIVEADSQNIDGKKLSNKIAKLAKEIRKFAKMEYSPNLDETSLEFQLNDTIINIKESNNAQIALQYRLDAELEKKLSNEIKQSIYRISQELFNNGHKYSGANLMSILIYKSKRNIVIQYDDDGIGTDKETITENKGLRYIQTYVKIFKGNMQVETAPQSGFSCIVELPLPIIYWLN